MNKVFEELLKNTEDILYTGNIIYNICEEDDGETGLKIRPLAELISKKADKMCMKIVEIEKQNKY